MAYGGPMVMMEDLSIFAQSIYAVTTTHATPATHAPIRLFFGFLSDRTSWLFLVKSFDS
jgi:hypothetical protein